jgi:subtilisin family serine protease
MPELEPDAPAAPQVDIEDQIVLTFNPKLAADRGLASALEVVEATLKKLQDQGATVLKTYVAATPDDKFFFGLSVLRLDNPKLTLEGLRKSRAKAFVDIVWFERNVPIALAGFNDPLSVQQWALAKLGVTGPWTVTPPAGNTMVAIVDSGLRLWDGVNLHVDLGRVESVIDCQPQPVVIAAPIPVIIFPGLYLDNIDQDGHGTLLAGTIAAVPCNAQGVSSAVEVAWNISLLPVKFFSPVAGPNAADAAIAIVHAVRKGAKVINASWHVAPGDKDLHFLRLALRFAKHERRLVVIAAGNAGTDNEIYPTFPANYGGDAQFKNKVLTALATDRYDAKASFSNYGKNIVDLAAPGLGILTTGRYLADPPRYAAYSGTSPAAAFASAGAALLFALHPPQWDGGTARAWKPRHVIQHLKASADTIEGLKLACIDGKRLNLRRAVYGPLHMTAPAEGDTLTVGVFTNITWTNDYNNPRFTKVKIEFSTDDGITYTDVDASTNNDGLRKWKPAAGDITPTGRIRIRPIKGNFPVVSDRFRVN